MRAVRSYATHIIVVANEKGGTGKSTTATHLAIGIQAQGHRIALLDLDHRQRSATRFLENRQAFAERHATGWHIPEHEVLAPSQASSSEQRDEEDNANLDAALERLSANHDFIVVDCPGGSSHLIQGMQATANTLLTPLNDSFVDLDLLAQVDPETYAVKRLSFFSEVVWESRKLRAASGLPGLDWVISRNRTSTTFSKNRQRMDLALKSLERRLAARYVRGLSDRVIFRELFPQGLTLEDIKDVDIGHRLTMSQVAARHELRTLLDDLALPGWGP